jgi:hypothetical protein
VGEGLEGEEAEAVLEDNWGETGSGQVLCGEREGWRQEEVVGVVLLGLWNNGENMAS